MGDIFQILNQQFEFYTQVLEIEPDNAWARDERRKYSRYLSYD